MRHLRGYVGRRVLVSTADGSFDGSLETTHDDALHLVGVTFTPEHVPGLPEPQPVRLEGLVAVPSFSVAYVQVV